MMIILFSDSIFPIFAWGDFFFFFFFFLIYRKINLNL